MSDRRKALMIASLRAKYKSEYSLKELLNYFNLKRPTYYYELNNRRHLPDKYAKVKRILKKIYKDSGETFGYRRLWSKLLKRGIHLCQDTVRKLTTVLGIKVYIYSKHTAKYHSYKGKIGAKAPNILKQHFNEHHPYHVLHTDVTQVRLANGRWVYISSIEDEASKEVLGITTAYSPKMPLIYRMINQIKNRIPRGIHPIIHSDQGWQYQMPEYHNLLHKLGYKQSMSRKGCCHDNAPAESLFSLIKREFLNRFKAHSLYELRHRLHRYIYWFNHKRISLRTEGLSPVKYRNKYLNLD